MEQNEQVTPVKTSALKKYLPGGIVTAVLGLLTFAIFHKPGTDSGMTKEVQKIDTVLIVARTPAGVVFLDSAIRAKGRTRIFKDSNGLEGEWMNYTAFRPGQLNDTVRDKTGHPILDSLKRPTIHMAYPPTFDTAYNKAIIVIEFPKQ